MEIGGIFCLPILCMTSLIAVTLITLYWYSNRDKRTVVVTAVATERRYTRSGTVDIWVVRHQNGREEMFFNGQNLFNWKYMAATVHIQQLFEVGGKYRLIVAGGKRFSQVGFFQNILHAEKIE